MPFNYEFPKKMKECKVFDFNWHMPLILSMFRDLNTILKLLTSLFLEKSTIFISKDPVKLSSAILGVKSMMNPLSWCHSLIPILPGQLLDYIESPCPILCGITKESYYLLLNDYKLD